MKKWACCKRTWFATAFIGLLLGALGTLDCQAATHTVTNAGDSDPGSLRRAIASAAPGDMIVFAGDYTIRLISGGDLVINKSLTIDGTGHAVQISGSGCRAFRVDGGSVTLRALTMSNGSGWHGGGGIANRGSLTLENCTLSGNRAFYLLGGYGGGIANYGSLTLENCTFAGNHAGDMMLGEGGGIWNRGSLTVRNCTFSGNSAALGGGIYNDGGTVNLYNTIIANSPHDDYQGAISINDHNLIGGNPLLGPLADNGGPTQTMALRSGSPAIDAGNDATSLATDQRGIARPRGAHCDIGAFESRPPEMDVQCNGISIADGDSTPEQADGTDFGNADPAEPPVVRAFTIINTGDADADLTLSGSPEVTLAGPNADDFTITVLPASPVPRGGSTTFEVSFVPMQAGLSSATISIENNDPDKNPYAFAISGRGILWEPVVRPVLYFPYLVSGSGNETELGIINKESYAVSGTIEFFEASGTAAGSRPLSLAARGKVSIASSAIPAQAASAVVTADGQLAGYGRALTATGQIFNEPGITKLMDNITIPFTSSSTYWRSGIAVFNPGTEEVTVTIEDLAQGDTSMALAAKAQQFFWVSGSPDRLIASGSIVAMEVFESTRTGGDLGAVALGEANGYELFVPSLLFSSGSFSGVGVRNRGLHEGTITVQGYDGDGNVEEVALGAITPRGQTKLDLTVALAGDTLWAKITGASSASSPVGTPPLPLQGITVYGESGLTAVGALNLNALKFRRGMVGVVDTANPPTVVVLNPGATVVQLTVTRYDSAGAVLEESEQTIVPGEMREMMFASTAGGHVKLESDAALYGYEIIRASGKLELLPVLR
jgi:hypothetical protein